MKHILTLLLAVLLPLSLMAQDPNNKPKKPVRKTEVKQQPAQQKPAPQRQRPAQQKHQSQDILTVTANGVTFTMVHVAGGSFTMGATSEQGSEATYDEKPAHTVTLSDYYIGETEVTQGLWEAVMGTTVSQQRDKANRTWSLDGVGANYPMYYISWEECQDFIRELNRLTGRQFRLPTEAEWEFAARGGIKTTHAKYAGSDAIDRVAWYDGNSGGETHPVKTKAPNELGLYDMSGNVWEWCQDWFSDYSSASQSNPKGPSSGSNRVTRGGGWYNEAWYFRVSCRLNESPSSRMSGIGLRLAL